MLASNIKTVNGLNEFFGINIFNVKLNFNEFFFSPLITNLKNNNNCNNDKFYNIFYTILTNYSMIDHEKFLDNNDEKISVIFYYIKNILFNPIYCEINLSCETLEKLIQRYDISLEWNTKIPIGKDFEAPLNAVIFKVLFDNYALKDAINKYQHISKIIHKSVLLDQYLINQLIDKIEYADNIKNYIDLILEFVTPVLNENFTCKSYLAQNLIVKHPNNFKDIFILFNEKNAVVDPLHAFMHSPYDNWVNIGKNFLNFFNCNKCTLTPHLAELLKCIILKIPLENYYKMVEGVELAPIVESIFEYRSDFHPNLNNTNDKMKISYLLDGNNENDTLNEYEIIGQNVENFT